MFKFHINVNNMNYLFVCVCVCVCEFAGKRGPCSDNVQTVDAPRPQIGEIVQMVANSTCIHIWECAKYNIFITCTRYVHGSSIKFHTQIVVPQVRCAKSTIPRTMSDIRVLVLLLFVCIFSRSTIYTKYQYVCVCVCCV